ncbi:ABC transporter substrate-binding protein [Bordetella sp. BOR01]|uniref:ABC transporter substrate-binding protein n=1 Tax=Bordetella sp. BOR01 TaxID=2854779 RepID=UPI001C46DBCA|nr:ABC transporter substrate-binding protein [Bordetella sp. BOR01]MBV7483417.1 ABC transporter substrate-binding protein [Bordetella sp. BOR01]
MLSIPVFSRLLARVQAVSRPTGRAAAQALLLALAASAALPAAAQTKVKIGLIGTNESQLPIVVAIDQGLFKAENIDVETVNFRGGGVAVQALVGGSVDLAAFATDHVLRLSNRGVQARYLVGIDRYITHILVVPSNKDYKSLADLRGGKIVVSAPGSYSDNVLRWTIKGLGLDPDKDFTIIGTGGGAAGRAGLDSGQVDAIMSTTPDFINDELESPGKYRILYDWRKIPHSGQAVVAKKDWIDDHPEAAKGIARAVLKAEQIIQTDPAAVERGVRTLFPERSDVFVKQFAAVAPNIISPDGRISESGFLKMVEILRSVEPDLEPIDQADVDLTNTLLER